MKIVETGQKIDLHLHSRYSSSVDGNRVEHGTLENLNILISKLSDNDVNICSITDHNFFSYEMYERLKKEELKNNSIKKVLPGIEFTVVLNDNQNKDNEAVHVIAIFDDTNVEKVKKINLNLINEKCEIKYDISNKKFTEDEFIKILKNIDLDIVLIVHQKNSIDSKKSQKNDLSNAAGDNFNNYIKTDYFQAIEFRNKKVEIFHKYYKTKNNLENLKWITGSDCHDWAYYPKIDKEDSMKESDFKFTYVKSLPTFKGLAMSFTDSNRISLQNNFFTTNGKYLKNIKINDAEIVLSKGINVIIGDNSIGKSALIHKITDFKYLDSKSLKNNYIKFFKSNNLKIDVIEDFDLIFNFDKQGGIQEKFKNDKKFFIDKYEPINNENNKSQLIKYLEKYLIHIQSKEEINNLYNNLDYKIKYKELTKKSYFPILTKIPETPSKIEGYQKLIEQINNVLTKIIEIIDDSLIDNDDKVGLSNDKIKFQKLLQKYKKSLSLEKLEVQKKNIINDILTVKISDYNQTRNTDETIKQEYNTQKTKLTKDILDLWILEHKYQPFNIDDNLKISVDIGSNLRGSYKFITKINANIEYIDKKYLEKLLNSPLKTDNKYTDVNNLEDLKRNIKFINENEDPIKQYQDKIKAKIDSDFTEKTRITKKKDNDYIEYSQGLNSKMYFDILLNESKLGVYIVDQPEDDISQKSLQDVIKNFKLMSKKRQILIVTHNPQLIVNLDVDNVIFISKKDTIEVKHGALEYEDNDSSILKIIAENIDGGIETIDKRWKRYDKNRN